MHEPINMKIMVYVCVSPYILGPRIYQCFVGETELSTTHQNKPRQFLFFRNSKKGSFHDLKILMTNSELLYNAMHKENTTSLLMNIMPTNVALKGF